MYGNSNMNQSGNFVNAASNPYVQNQFVQNQQSIVAEEHLRK